MVVLKIGQLNHLFKHVVGCSPSSDLIKSDQIFHGHRKTNKQESKNESKLDVLHPQ